MDGSSAAADGTLSMPAEHQPMRSDRFVRSWPYLRGGLQLLGLLTTCHEGLHAVAIGVQALAVTGDVLAHHLERSDQ